MYKLFFKNLEKLMYFEKEKYITEEGKFTKEYKMPFKDFAIYLVGNRGKTTVLEIDEYVRVKCKSITERVAMRVSKQNISKQRTYIDPVFFKDASIGGIKEIYSSKTYPLKKFKDLNAFAIDGSQGKIPNTSQTREEFDVDLNSLEKTKTPKVRVSVMSDVKNGFIIDSNISSLSTGESVLASENIENAAKIVDLSESILIFDRNYASAELIIQILEKDGYFIFRLKSDTYKKERKKMKTDDEWVDINLNKSRTNNVKNEYLKAKAEELDYLNLRIVNVPIKSGTETLLTNLPEDIASPAELKNLYGERWEIEKGYDVLKNKLEMENFSGKRRITIEQDFYCTIFMYNALMEYKAECNIYLRENPKYKHLECEYKVNMSVLAGKLKTSIYEMFLTDSAEERRLIEEDIFNIAKKNTIKVEKKPSASRNKNPLSGKYPYNNRKLC